MMNDKTREQERKEKTLSEARDILNNSADFMSHISAILDECNVVLFPETNESKAKIDLLEASFDSGITL